MYNYESKIIWTGNRGEGTKEYDSYDRTWDINIPNKKTINCSNDPILGGDSKKMNPEDLLISSLAACHMLWYLHFASDENIVVIDYIDNPLGTGEVKANGAGRFLKITLRPEITLKKGSDVKKAFEIHSKIHDVCFISRSLNFPVDYKPKFKFGD